MTNSLHNWKNHADNLKLGLRFALIVFTLVVMGRVMTQALGDLRSYPGIDLRVKVGSARLLIRGMNPYADFRHESLPDHLRPLNEDTYSPPLLVLYSPLCELPWKLQRIIYFCADWIAILLCFVVVSRVFPKNIVLALWLGFVLLFVAAPGFRLHLERGQYYIELALLISLASVNSIHKRDSWLHALPLALLVLFRPTYAICILCLLILRRVRLAVIAACLCAMLFALMLPLAGIRDWKNYLQEIRFNQLETADAAYASAPAPPSPAQSQIVEGIDFSRSLTYPGYLADRTLTGVAESSVSPFMARLIHRIAPSVPDFRRINTAGLLLACLFDVVVMYGFSRKCGGGLIPTAFLFLAPLNLEFFAPQHFAYCDVTILAPTLLVIAAILEISRRVGWVIYSVILMIGAVLPYFAVHFNKHVPMASFFSYVGVLAILNLVCLVEAWGSQRFLVRFAVTGRKQIGDCATV